MKTIKELADELGVSKQAIHKHVKQLPPTLLSTGDNRAILIKDEGIAIICGKIGPKAATVDSNQPSTVDTLVDMLQRELHSKNTLLESQSRQLEEQTATIREQAQSIQELTGALARQQALHAGTIQQQLLEGESTQAEPEPEPAARPGLWQRIFGKS